MTMNDATHTEHVPKIHSTVKNAALLFLFSAALGVIANITVFDHAFAFGFTIAAASALVVLMVSLYAQEQKITPTTWVLAAATLFFALMISVRESVPLTAINFLASAFFLALTVSSAAGVRLRELPLLAWIMHWLMPLFAFIHSMPVIGQGFRKIAHLKKHDRTSQVVRGLLIALPVLFIFTILFASADLAFEAYFKDILEVIALPENIVPRAFVFAIVFVLSAGALAIATRSVAFMLPKGQTVPQRYSIGVVESSVVLGLVNVLFLVFVLIQAAYMFGGEANISELGYTYAEYARNGFFELIVVAALALLLLWAFEEMSVRTAKRFKVFQSMSLILVAQVFVVMASSFYRLALYESAYGFTNLRLYSHVFIVWLAVVFVLFAVKLFNNMKEARFVFGAFIAGVVCIVALNAMNPELFIARRNLALYESTDRLDVPYIAWQLSTDAQPVLFDIMNNTDLPKQKRKEAAEELRSQYRRVEGIGMKQEPWSWQDWNWSRSQARERLMEQIDAIKAVANPEKN